MFAVIVSSGESVIGFIDTYSNRDKETVTVDDAMINDYHSTYSSNGSLPLAYVNFSSASIYTVMYCKYGVSVVSLSYAANV